ncbi:uncharacterized protein LOC100211334 [Hydra vulgaris]|uniref:uncharacterized protein LOC100211334 n=1 Tax=Hydra vulgaris TaxID=6087 RepID=UPI001F5F783F|nr:uncharacterized protein LOC100211334 [Hydra vulgaris]
MANEAPAMFLSIVNSLKDPLEKTSFFNWLSEYLTNQNEISCNHKKIAKSGEVLLSCIKSAIKEKVPFDAIMDSEKICFPTVGEDSHLHSKNSIHVDAFLYDDDDVEDLVEEGKLTRYFCKSCGSADVDKITFITHSTSKERLQYIFLDALPSLKGKTIVDIGSRLGSVLYGAYVYSEAESIIGIEMNSELCKLQNEIITRFKLTNRIKIVEGNMIDKSDIIKSAHVVVLNNVFEWFVSVEEQNELWRFLHKTLPKDCIIVATPEIDKSLDLLSTGIVLDLWLKEIFVPKSDLEFVELSCIKFYSVL